MQDWQREGVCSTAAEVEPQGEDLVVGFEAKCAGIRRACRGGSIRGWCVLARPVILAQIGRRGQGELVGNGN